jgi:hypothetical protein
MLVGTIKLQPLASLARWMPLVTADLSLPADVAACPPRAGDLVHCLVDNDRTIITQGTRHDCQDRRKLHEDSVTCLFVCLE